MKPLEIRRANECLARPEYFAVPRKLFDAFWREGELAILFGATGTGKSVLAMDLAEALARGRPMEGFEMPEYRRRVLYVDLVASEAQFQLRYSTEGPGMASAYKFSDALYRDRPKEGDSFAEWLRKAVHEKRIKAVVIDDLGALRNSLESTKEALRIVRELKRLKDELGISILLLASAAEAAKGRLAAETDLRRMQPLAEAADSVFAIGRSPRDRSWKYLIQTRSRNGAIVWTSDNAPMARIEKEADGFLKMTFDGRFQMGLNERTIELIRKVKELRDGRLSYRKIGLALNISYTQAQRLHKKWTPDMNSGQLPVVSGQKERETERCGDAEPGDDRQETGDERDKRSDEFVGCDCFECISGNAAECLDKEVRERHDKAAEDNGAGTIEPAESDSSIDDAAEQTPRETDPPSTISTTTTTTTTASAVGRRTIYDLTRRLNDYGKEIFIEEEGPDERHPHIWYNIDNKGYIYRWVWRTGRRLGPAPYIEMDCPDETKQG